MGKKSRRKGGNGASKTARKERLLGRHGQHPEDIDEQPRTAGDNNRPFFVGDRVWIGNRWGCLNPNSYRGIVKNVHDNSLDIVPLQSEIDGNNNFVRADLKDVFPDFCDMTLRFDVGDEVLCSAKNSGWEAMTVKHLWPVGRSSIMPLLNGPEDAVPRYYCEGETGACIAHYDDDACIRRKNSTLRLRPGESVRFDLHRAMAPPSISKQTRHSWVEGTIISVDIRGMIDYASYKCAFRANGKRHFCHVVEDDDEHIARSDTPPRSRLLEAIEQGCSRDHLVYLSKEFKIDVTTFRDFIVAKALEHASYQALSWLQHDCDIDVIHIKDDLGNNLLHKIASSRNAVSFITEAAGVSTEDTTDDIPDWSLDITDIAYSLANMKNNEGETWLDVLVVRGDTRAFDAALSPHVGLAWTISYEDSSLKAFSRRIRYAGNAVMQVILDSFLAFREPLLQCRSIESCARIQKEEDFFNLDRMHVFQGKESAFHARLLARFYLDWHGYRGHLLTCGHFFNRIVMNGFSDFFQLLYNAHEGVFMHEEYTVYPRADRLEYTQSKLLKKSTNDNAGKLMKGDVFFACAVGDERRVNGHVADDYVRQYLREVETHAVKCDKTECPTWLSHLKRLIVMKRYHGEQKNFLEFKISLLEDSKSLPGRVKIMDFLLQRDLNPKSVNPLELIRNRQSGMLKFMVERGLLRLEEKASSNRHLTKYPLKLQFLAKGHIPPLMSTNSFLCFAAVQYDDLASLEYLSDLSGVPIDLCDGLNLLHFCSMLGRSEIVAHLSRQPTWNALVAEPCRRAPYQNAFAVHISASVGHIMLADMLLALNVPAEDKRGELPEHYAKKSIHKFVREWAAKRELPNMLERNVEKLLKLISLKETSFDNLKSFIIDSKCLDPEVWVECGFDSFDMKGAQGQSFQSLLTEFCTNTMSGDVANLAICICTSLYFKSREPYVSPFFWKERDPVERKILTHSALVEFAVSHGYNDLAEYLPKQWFRKVTCSDPLAQNHLLESVLSGSQLLQEVRSKILRLDVLGQIVDNSHSALRTLCVRGGSVHEFAELLRIICEAKLSLEKEGRDDSSLCGDNSDITQELKPLYMSNFYTSVEYGDDHPLMKSIAFEIRSRTDLANAHIVLATEGYSELLEHCLKHVPGWSSDMELDVCHIAALFGHSAALDIFLNQDYAGMLSEQSERIKAAMLGSAESCRCRELSHLVDRFGPPPEPIKDEATQVRVRDEDYWDELQELRHQSLSCFAINGYASKIFGADTDDRQQLTTLQYLVDHLGYTHSMILDALICLWKFSWQPKQQLTIINSFQDIMNALQLQPILHNEQMRAIGEEIISSCRYWNGKFDEEGKQILEWLEKMTNLGVDIQHLAPRNPRDKNKTFMDKCHDLEQKQSRNWGKFDVIKNGASLEGIQQMVHNGLLKIGARDRGGLKLTHISAAYDRSDLLEWLVTVQGMMINEKDGQGRTVLDIAQASKAPLTTKWIMEWTAKQKIVSFVWQNYHRMVTNRRRQRSFDASTAIQACFRGHLARKIYSSSIIHRLEESQRFCAIWGQLIKSMPETFSSWASIRENVSDMNNAESMFEEDGYFDDTDNQLSRSLEDALQVDSDDMAQRGTLNDALDIVSEEMKISSHEIESKPSWLAFQMTSHVVKFLKRGDLKYKQFFVRRMMQLASGDRSRILQKRLKGSQSTIYESYLEQKSGFRILWTEEGDNVIVWFIAKHKDVSRLMKLIDDSKNRSARQHCPESLLSQLSSENLIPNAMPQKDIILDVFGNVPMKLYDVSIHSISEMTLKDWSPKLHLTENERDVVETEGTTLVLGRSGTGKTVCICNRMEYDRQKYGQDPTFGQIFISRSSRLCRYVSVTVVKSDQNAFCTFEELIRDIEAVLPRGEKREQNFLPSQHVNYQRFRKDFFDKDFVGNRTSRDSIGPLIVWTVIRTFLKGSIEAFKSPGGILPGDDFVGVGKLGKNRCQVPGNLRGCFYDEFLKYETHKNQNGLWDDCDRIRRLLLRLDALKRSDAVAFEGITKSRVYVDEVQDYTQIEMLLFFVLGGPGGLFLAGDSAQSVVEGTTFRFDEVRSVGYFVAGNNESRSLIPQKPKIVNVNYRSHSGILNVAGTVLDLLYSKFPSSVKQLPKDHGLFQGSRPSLIYKVSARQLAVLLSDKLKGSVVLCHDDSTNYWRRTLGEYKLVYGIREAKGLEFKSVIILNFFHELPASLQKPWRNMLLNREGQDFGTKYPIVEAQLKLLYTGITRSIERLFFVETSQSISFDAVVRWLTTSSVKRGRSAISEHGDALATRNNINDIEAMAMTSDEFLSEGFNNAEMAESPDVDLEMAQNFLDKAVWCFDQAGNTKLARKARAHRLSILFRIGVIDTHSRENENDSAMMVEMKGAQIMESLAREGLMIEMFNVFYAISPFLTVFSKKELQRVLSTARSHCPL